MTLALSQLLVLFTLLVLLCPACRQGQPIRSFMGRQFSASKPAIHAAQIPGSRKSAHKKR